MSSHFFIRCVLLSAAAACASTASTARLAPEDRALGRHLEALQYQGAPAASDEDIVLARTRGGSVRAARPGVDVARATDPDADDAALEVAVRARLSGDPLVAGLGIDVDVDDGVVTLRGRPSGRAIAARAVRRTLEVPGVVAVESRLTWIRATDRLQVRRPAAGQIRTE